MVTLPVVGVIGTGAMGLGVVRSLVRGGFRVLVRDIRPEAEAAAVAAGATARATPAALARDSSVSHRSGRGCRTNRNGAVRPGGRGRRISRAAQIVIVSSTVAPAFVASLQERLGTKGARLLDAPVSGGPQRAADGSMTIMVAGDTATIGACRALLSAISGKCFVVGTRPGVAATFKVLNNQLAAVNLAAGAEAMALAMRSGVDPRLFLEVVNASSGASWIFNDRMTRALDGDATPRAATALLNKDVGIAVATAADAGIRRAAGARGARCVCRGGRCRLWA